MRWFDAFACTIRWPSATDEGAFSSPAMQRKRMVLRGARGRAPGCKTRRTWCKLALVLAGRASETLLDSYEQERRPLAEKWLRRADRLVAISVSPSPVFTGARNFAASFLLPRLARRRTSRSALFRLVSQLGVRYTDSSVVAEDMTNADGDFRSAPGKGRAHPTARSGSYRRANPPLSTLASPAERTISCYSLAPARQGSC